MSADAFELFLFAGAGDLVFEFVADVEVIIDRSLAAACDEADVDETRFDRFFDAVLHAAVCRRSAESLSASPSSRQKPRAVAGHGKQTLLDHYDA
jgi:hypothetical protein